MPTLKVEIPVPELPPKGTKPLPIEDAAEAAGISTRTLRRLIEAKRVKVYLLPPPEIQPQQYVDPEEVKRIYPKRATLQLKMSFNND